MYPLLFHANDKHGRKQTYRNAARGKLILKFDKTSLQPFHGLEIGVLSGSWASSRSNAKIKIPKHEDERGGVGCRDTGR